jgi:predicted MFS family arabinose efflux permease
VVCSAAAYFFIYNYPATAGFLTPKEREFIAARLKDDGDATREEKFTWDGVFRALKDIKVWLYALCFFTVGFPGYTISLFLPTIINGLGYTAAQAQLLSIAPYGVAFITTMTVAVLSERTKRRAPFIIGCSSVAIVGYIILISSHWAGMSFAGTIIVLSGTFPATAVIVSWPANNVSGQTKRATASALQISVGNIAAIVGTQLYRPEWGPRYFVGHGLVRVSRSAISGNVLNCSHSSRSVTFSEMSP